MNWYAQAIKRYIDIEGRSSRTEFWMFVLTNIIFAVLAFFLDNLFNINFEKGRIGYGPIYILYALFSFVPGITISIRRLHDTGRSGLYFLISLIPIVGSIWLLILYCLESDKGNNKYGPNVEGLDVEQIQHAIKNNGNTYKDNTLINSTKNSDRNSDAILFLVVAWIFLSDLFWTLIRRLRIDFYNTASYNIVNYFIKFIWILIPLMIAFTIKDKNKRIICYVIAAFYASVQIIEELIIILY